ncbi:hypothetical protein Mgra_00001544 [Meloidogyne graminicola]|uniref:Uncharacterized protein n=1 Tax=Meloidogyne graminicola TaxID=189291 RepID=A0A8T0A0J3_9BILA|nr:hypothetical protein Mgra_00001544 [Meloidogyne graminicola]
MLIKGGILNH